MSNGRKKAWLLASLALLGACSPGQDNQAAQIQAAEPVAVAPPADATEGYAPQAIAGMLQTENKGYFYSPGRWPTNAIAVCWEVIVPKGVEREWVKDAISRSWQAHSALRFIGWSDCAPNAVGIRIAVRDVSVNDGPHTIGLGYALNTKPAGMVLNFTFNTWSQDCAQNAIERESCIRSIAVHEFGHAIGFAHEQNRPDTPGECKTKPQGGNGDVMLTPWDPHSVMNYCNAVYNNNGILSDGDISSVRHEYGA